MPDDVAISPFRHWQSAIRTTKVVAHLGGNRRIGPGRHLLTNPAGSPIATFETKRVASAIELRSTRVVGPEGDERCTLVPVESAVESVRAFWAAAVGDDGHVVRFAGETIGRLGSATHEVSGSRLWSRAVRLASEASDLLRGNETEQLVRILTLNTPLEPRLCAALLLYDRFVIAPARTLDS